MLYKRLVLGENHYAEELFCRDCGFYIKTGSYENFHSDGAPGDYNLFRIITGHRAVGK